MSEFTWIWHTPADYGGHWALRVDGLPSHWWLCPDGDDGYLVMRGASIAGSARLLHTGMMKAQDQALEWCDREARIARMEAAA